MIVVADTSVFIALIQIDLIDILPQLLQQIVIPPAVAMELAAPNRSAPVRAFAANPPDWLSIRKPLDTTPIEGLDAGESAAIHLATEINASLIILDEARGRRVAMTMGLRVVGTIGLLENAADVGLADLGVSFARLAATDFWVSRAFLDERLARYRRRP